MKNKITPGAYEFMIACTAYFDALVADALAAAIRRVQNRKCADAVQHRRRAGELAS